METLELVIIVPGRLAGRHHYGRRGSHVVEVTGVGSALDLALDLHVRPEDKQLEQGMDRSHLIFNNEHW